MRADTLAAGLTKTPLGRPRCQRAALLRLGLDHPDRPGGTPLAAGPPPPRHGELTFYRCPTLVPLGALVRVAGRRWAIEESFETGNGLAGLDEYQVRRWLAWRRWTPLAHTLLAVIARPNTPSTDRPAS